MVPGRSVLGRPWRWLAALLILTATGLHVAYLAYACPLDLAPDEAHYWDWSRHLDWSYYSKGPLVAYLIRAGCALAGGWARHFPAGDMLAVRLPAVLCGGLLLVSLYVLTVQVFRREALAAAVVALGLTFPVLAAGSLLMTIDAPYTCCWGWALVLGHRAVLGRSAWAWPAAGLLVGLGALAKYTMVLWVPSLGLFLLASSTHRRELLRPGFWVLTAVAAACCLPMLLWNVRHGWVGLRHVGGLAGLHDGPGFLWWGPLAYVGTQAGLLLGFWFGAWFLALVAHRPWREPDAGRCYLWWMSVPMFGVFLLASGKTPGEANWPVTAYLSGLVLAAGWLERQWQMARPGSRRLLAAGLAGAGGLGLVLTGLLHFSHWAYPWLTRLVPATDGTPLRRLDPTCRLRGWRDLAAEVDRLRAALAREGGEPVLAAASWTLPGELAFYCAGRPTVYSLGLALGDRHSQYDLWRPNPVWDGEQFRGRTFIYVGDIPPALGVAFDTIEPPRLVTHRVGGHPVARWTVTVCRGFHGFRAPTEMLARQRF